MKTLLLTLILVPLIVTASFYPQIKERVCPEKAISKNIGLQILSVTNYEDKIYLHSSAKLNIMVIKLKGNTMDTLLVKDYPRFKLSNISSYSKDFNEVIQVPNIVDSKEQIILLYNITYKSKGELLQMPFVNWIPKGAAKENILITI